MVELYPAASRPIAHIYFAEFPKLFCRATDADYKSISLSEFGFVIIYAPNVIMTAELIKNEIKREIELSMTL
jgi:hypothetical protein